MKRALLLSLLLCSACSAAPTPAGAPTAEAPSDDRVFVEATIIETNGDVPAVLDPASIDALAAQGKLRKASSTHVLARHDTATHVAPEGTEGFAVDVLPHIVDAGHVRVEVALAWDDERAETTVVVADRQPIVMGTAKAGRTVLLTARIVRSESDLKAIFEEKRTEARQHPPSAQ